MRKWLAVLVVLSGCGALTPPKVDSGVPDASVAEADAGADAGSPVDAGPCDGGFCRPEKITGELIDPWDLAVDGTNVYWLEYGLATNGLDGQLMRQRKDTVCLKRDAGCADDLNTRFNGRFRVDSMTLAGSELCWTENYADARDVLCQSVVSNAERLIASNQPAATRPIAAGGDLLWVNYGTSAAAQDGQVMRKPLSAPTSTAPTIIASMRRAPNTVAVSQGHYVWAEAGSSLDAGLVLAQPMDGGALVTVASMQRSPLSVVDCGGSLYWARYGDGAIVQGSVAPNSADVLVQNQKSPFQIVCDATHLYWLNSGVSANGADGELWQARLDGSEAAVMVQGISLAWALTLDDEYVYYIAQGTVTRVDGVIWRVRKHR